MWNKTKSVFSLALVTALSLGSAVVAAESGVYIGVGLGESSFDVSSSVLDDGSAISNFSKDDSDKAQKIYIGYRAHTHVAVELGYIDLGKVEASGTSDGSGDIWMAGNISAEPEVDGLFFGIKGILPVADQFSAFINLGVLDWETNTRATDSGPAVISTRESDADLYYGAGGSFRAGSFDIKLEYNRYDVDDADVDVISLGADLRF